MRSFRSFRNASRMTPLSTPLRPTFQRSASRIETSSRLSPSSEGKIAQMVIAIFPSLDGESLEDVSIRLAERWKVGRKGVDNGVILLAFLKERKLRIEVGYGLEQ